MKVTEVELHPVATRRRNGSLNYHVTVLLHTDAGVTGLGEFSDLSHTPAMMPDLEDLAAYLDDLLGGVDPTNGTRVEETLAEPFPPVAKSAHVKVGLEIACHDAAAKALDVPLHQLLGGAKRDRIPICYPIFRTQSVEEVPQQLGYVEMALDAGFDAIRYYFGADLEADERFLSELEATFGDEVTVKSLDASNRFSWKEALSAYDRLDDYAFSILESPVPKDDIEGMARVTERVDRPVSEHIDSLSEAMTVIQRGAVDVFNVSLAGVGGVRAAQRVHDLAASAGVDCLVGTTQEMSIGTAAQAHVGATARCDLLRSDPVGAFLYTSDVVEERVQYEDGYLLVPDGPGLGMTVDEEKLAEHREPLSMLD
jgi:L-alanine-DL-glutamate epimerase-like enolase superfamily enzyme